MKLFSSVVAFSALTLISVCVQAAPDKDKRSLTSIATVLVRDNHSTRIPKGAILYFPKSLSSRVSSSLHGEYLSWRDFLKKNRSWIHLHEVTMKQAAGREIIKPQVVKSWSTFGKMVIAVNQGDPVSVKPKAYSSTESQK